MSGMTIAGTESEKTENDKVDLGQSDDQVGRVQCTAANAGDRICEERTDMAIRQCTGRHMVSVSEPPLTGILFP